MSGPKVVKIVTREELVEICEGHISSLEAAIRQWQRVGTRNDVVSEADVAEAHQRLVAIRTLLSRDRFEEVQKQVPAEIAFLKEDIERRIDQAARKAAEARKKERRALAVAESVRSALVSRGLVPSPVLETPERYRAEEVRKAIEEGFAVLSPSEARTEVTERQRELAAFLGDGEERATVADWLRATAPQQAADPALLSLEQRLEGLRALDPDTAAAFDARLAALHGVEGDTRAGLLIDSLNVEIAAARKAASARLDLCARLESVRDQLRALGFAEGITRAQVIDGILADGRDEASLRAEVASSEALLSELRSRKTGLLRRQALLAGLSRLGYDVNDQMETAWVEDGRVALRHGASATYGVEVGGNPEGMVQLRTVAFDGAGSTRTNADDLNAETAFCDAFSALQSEFADNGGDIAVVKALGIGAVAVKSASADVQREADERPDVLPARLRTVSDR